MKELNVENETIEEFAEHMHKCFHNSVVGKDFRSPTSEAEIIKENTDRLQCIKMKISVWTQKPFEKIQAINKL